MKRISPVYHMMFIFRRILVIFVLLFFLLSITIFFVPVTADVNTQLEITAPLSVEEGESFQVTITVNGVPIENAEVSFSDEMKLTPTPSVSSYLYAVGTDGIYSFSIDEVGRFTLKDKMDGDGVYQSVWGDGNYVYAAGAHGLFSYQVDEDGKLELKGSYTPASFGDVWGDGNYVYVAHAYGIVSFSVNETGEFTPVNSLFLSGCNSIWGDGTFIYAVAGENNISSHHVDDGQLLYGDTVNDVRDSVWGDGTFIYAPSLIGERGISSFSINKAGEFTLVDTLETGSSYRSVWGDGSFVYTADGDGVSSFSVDTEGDITLADSQETGLVYKDVWCDGSFVYAAWQDITSFSVDKGRLSEVDHYDEEGYISYNGVWGDYEYNDMESNGTVTFTAPYVSQDSVYTITAIKDGFETAISTVTITNNDTSSEEQLSIVAPLSVNESEIFQVSVSADGSPIEDVLVNFSGSTYYTGVDGTVSITAPLVDVNTDFPITAFKSGFLSDGTSITVTDSSTPPAEPQLVLSAPSSVVEGNVFQVSVMADGGFVKNVFIDFSGVTKSTDVNGMVTFTAPLVDENTSYSIVAYKSGFLSDEASIIVMGSSSTSEPQLVLSAPSSVMEEDSFQVTVMADGEVVEDVVVSFSDDIYTTNSQGKVTFTAPLVDSKTDMTITSSKTGYISSSKTIGILDKQETSIILTYPNGGENLSSSIDVTWDVANLPDLTSGSLNVEILYQKDTGSWDTIVKDLQTLENKYKWDITSVENYDKYLLKIILTSSSSDGESWMDVSDGTFSIYNPPKKEDGWVYGKVIENNENSTPIENAMVCIANSPSGDIVVNMCRYTGGNGKYSISLFEGIYTVKVSKLGYETKTIKDVYVGFNQGTSLNNIILNKTQNEDAQSVAEYMISEEVKKGTIFGVVDVSTREEQVSLYQNVSIDVISSDIGLEDGINIVVSGEGQPGTKIVIYVGVVENPEEIKVLFDGKQIEKASYVEAFFSKDNNNSEWILTSTIDGSVISYAVIVNIPHFSEHTINIYTTIPEVLGRLTILLTYFALVAIVAIAAAFHMKYIWRK